MYGGGLYFFESVKEIAVTKDFKSLREDQKECQSYESYEQCTTNQIMKKILHTCECYPHELIKFSNNEEVSFFIPLVAV